MRFALDLSSGKLFNNRTYFYASLKFGDRSFFVQLWDSPRVQAKPNTLILHRGPVMTLSVGTWTV
jgi:hypothetical protein